MSSSICRAATSGTSYIGGGLTLANFAKTTATNDASLSLIGKGYYIPIQYTYFFNILDRPAGVRASYTPIPRESSDGAGSSTILQFSMNKYHNFESGMGDFNYGLGYIIKSFNGKGGSLSLPNGTGTSTFYRPDKNVSTNNFIIETGVSLNNDTSRYSAELFFSQLFSERRSYTLKFTYNYKLNSSF